MFTFLLYLMQKYSNPGVQRNGTAPLENSGEYGNLDLHR